MKKHYWKCTDTMKVKRVFYDMPICCDESDQIVRIFTLTCTWLIALVL